MWFNIIKKENPIAASYATKQILRLADKIEELVPEVKIHSPNIAIEQQGESGAKLEFSLEDSKGKKNPVGYISFVDLTSWKKYKLDSIRDIRNRYLREVEQIERRWENQIEDKKTLLRNAKDRYEERIKEVKLSAFQESHYFTFRWHERNDRDEYNDSMEEAIESHKLGFEAIKAHTKKYDEDSIIQMIKELKDFIKEKQFSWEEGSS